MIRKIYEVFILVITIFGGIFLILNLVSIFSKIFTKIPGGILIAMGLTCFILVVILIIIEKLNPKLFDIISLIFTDKEDSIKNEKAFIQLRDNIMDNFKKINIENSTNKVEGDIFELMLINMKEIKEYYILSKNQAKRSFILAIIMCILGLVFLSISIIFSFILKQPLEVSIFPAISGAIVEFIAGTALLIYNKTLSQLNHYFKSLHDNEKFLSGVNLVSKLTPNKRDEMYTEIIKAQILDKFVNEK